MAARLPPEQDESFAATFPSLTIATGRGPIFVAKLQEGRASVTAENALTLWACDFTGHLQLLIRTGDSAFAPGKTLKNFAALKASVGSEGVRRSFNDQGQVAWRATFTDQTQAIFITEVP